MHEHNDEAIGKLTDAQRECLRLVMAGYKSKEIAHELGIGIDAVNKRLAAAKAAIGAPSRFAAARRYAAYVARQPYHSLVGHSLAIEADRSLVDREAQTPIEEWSNDQQDHRHSVAEDSAPYTVTQRLPLSAARSFDLGQLFATPLRVFIITTLAGAIGALAFRS